MDRDIAASDPKPFRLAKSMFKSCMNKDGIEARGVTPLIDVMNAMGGWPLLEGSSWDKDLFKWHDRVYNGFLVDYMLNFYVIPDLKNSSWRALYLDQPSLGMSREYLIKGLDDEYVQVGVKYDQIIFSI